MGKRVERRERNQWTDREKSQWRSCERFILEEVSREQGSFGRRLHKSILEVWLSIA